MHKHLNAKFYNINHISVPVIHGIIIPFLMQYPRKDTKNIIPSLSYFKEVILPTVPIDHYVDFPCIFPIDDTHYASVDINTLNLYDLNTKILLNRNNTTDIFHKFCKLCLHGFNAVLSFNS